MNKQELIKHIEDLPYNEGLIVDTIKISRNGLLKLIEQLDEPEKVKVKQFVADWYRINKDNFYKNIAYLCANWVKSTTDDTLFNCMSNTDNFIESLVNMLQFGYEVEKEKRYRVRLKGLDKDLEYLNFKHGHVWVFSDNIENEEYRTCHTRKQLEEAGFGWAFDCPEIVIEEVEG